MDPVFINLALLALIAWLGHEHFKLKQKFETERKVFEIVVSSVDVHLEALGAFTEENREKSKEILTRRLQNRGLSGSSILRPSDKRD